MCYQSHYTIRRVNMRINLFYLSIPLNNDNNWAPNTNTYNTTLYNANPPLHLPPHTRQVPIISVLYPLIRNKLFLCAPMLVPVNTTISTNTNHNNQQQQLSTGSICLCLQMLSINPNTSTYHIKCLKKNWKNKPHTHTHIHNHTKSFL